MPKTPTPPIRDRDLSFIEDDLEALGMQRPPAEALRVLNMLFPEVSHDLDGAWHMPPDQAAQLDAFFEAFGVPVRTTNAPLAAIERAYGICALGLTHFVNLKLRQPGYFGRRTRDWPAAWREYIEAVASLNRPEAQRLAAQLQPLDPDCVMPDSMLTLVQERESRP